VASALSKWPFALRKWPFALSQWPFALSLSKGVSHAEQTKC